MKLSNMPVKLVAVAEAPVKAIVSGEHGVVHGTPGIAIALSPCNRAELYEEEQGEPGLALESSKGKVFVSPTGIASGTEAELKTFAPFVAAAKFVFSKGLVLKKHYVAKLSVFSPKGTGTGSSVAAALALCLFKLLGRAPVKSSVPEEDELWMASQAADEVAHGTRPSGIDAMAVCHGNTQLLRTVEGGKVKWNFEPKHALSLPKGTEFLVVDTFVSGERSGTGALVFAVAKNLGLTKIGSDGKEVVKPLAEFSDADKKKVEPFERVFEKIVSQLHESGDAKALGAAMDENHELLAKLGASSDGIGKAVAAAKRAGALGAKITGAGGNGGAVLVLVESSKKKQVEDSIRKAGFSIFEARACGHGARLL